MKDNETIKNLLSPDDFMVSIDLHNAFHSISLHTDSQHLVVFEFENCRYNFNAIPFGLTSAPRVFTKVLRPVISFLRNCGIKITSYLDDIFICGPSYDKVKSDLKFTLDLLINLGFSINWNKSHLTPSQNICHLGYIWNSRNCTINLPGCKLSKIKSLASKCLSSAQTVRTYSALLGLLVSSANAFRYAALYYRKFQLCFIDAIKSCHDWDDIWPLSSEALIDLLWWQNCSLDMITPVTFLLPKTDLVLFTDASLIGWGASISSGVYTSGKWSSSDSKLHINFLELKAIFLALKEFLPLLTNKNLSIRCDNSTAIAYFNKIGGTHSKTLCLLALRIWSMIKDIPASCVNSHISGIDNSICRFLLQAYSSP